MMNKSMEILCVMVLTISGLVGQVLADTILFEGFDEVSGFSSVAVGSYWDIATLNGTISYPSHFRQGGSQDGNIFYGSNAKESSDSGPATMTITLPDLSLYTNLVLSVALAAGEYDYWDPDPDRGLFEPTHRDSLHIIGSITTTSPDLGACTAGCIPPVTGVIDSFLPITYPDDLQSAVYSVRLGHDFKDFNYAINSTLRSVTFAFASTAIEAVNYPPDPMAAFM